jgi:hypothetical protein
MSDDKDGAWEPAFRSAFSQYESYVRQGQTATPEQRHTAMHDALQHAVGIIRLRDGRQHEAEITRLRSELSAAKEAEAAAQLAVLGVRGRIEEGLDALEEATNNPCTCGTDELNCPYCNAWSAARSKLDKVLTDLSASPTPTEEKVRRLVVAAREVIDDRNNVALRGHDNLQAALSEVEALIGTPQQSKGG